ncbi:hypothetical protein TrVE_jg4919 [Triparma verrucosa]|uniref:Uncharacterized protein n=1 Tax=Triparma verrucosa TaxID=1606542 RepID=A0A9W7BY11_9STRA|nr:hypothetical protein TrVE_jg4919 [Triparma verrucosa]
MSLHAPFFQKPGSTALLIDSRSKAASSNVNPQEEKDGSDSDERRGETITSQVVSIISQTVSLPTFSNRKSSPYPIISTGMYPSFLTFKMKRMCALKSITFETNNVKRIRVGTATTEAKAVKEVKLGSEDYGGDWQDRQGENNRQLFTLQLDGEVVDEISVVVEEGFGEFCVFWGAEFEGEVGA